MAEVKHEKDLPQWTPGDDNLEELKAKQLSPTTSFELFFHDELFDLMVEETARYAWQRNKI